MRTLRNIIVYSKRRIIFWLKWEGGSQGGINLNKKVLPFHLNHKSLLRTIFKVWTCKITLLEWSNSVLPKYMRRTRLKNSLWEWKQSVKSVPVIKTSIACPIDILRAVLREQLIKHLKVGGEQVGEPQLQANSHLYRQFIIRCVFWARNRNKSTITICICWRCVEIKTSYNEERVLQ